jgi:hypothetical protein
MEDLQQLQTRTEHSRSLEDAEKLKALETLKEVGMLIPVTELDTYHGRVAHEGEDEWSVDPTFSNASNDSGNDNVNERSVLYTSDAGTAQEFADTRRAIRNRVAFRKHVKEQIGNYNAEQRQEWLKRVNDPIRKHWESLTDEQRSRHAEGLEGMLKKDENLDNLTPFETNRIIKEMDDAEKTALSKRTSEGTTTEIHEIATTDADATILDFGFDSNKLDEASKEKYQDALRKLILPVTEGSPVKFDDRNKTVQVATAIRKLGQQYITSEQIADLAAEAQVSESVALQMASAFNSRWIASFNPGSLIHKLFKTAEDITTETIKDRGENKELPLNMEYAQRYLRQAHIVGVRQTVDSTTIDREIKSISFFDLEKTNSIEQLDARRQETWKQLGGMATALSKIEQTTISEHPLLQVLTDAHAKPQTIVEAAMKLPGYKDIFESDTGNWERFTLAEHTETVLRNFDENYADQLPVSFLGPMRMAIVAHDLGKPTANQEYRNQKEYNLAFAGDFFDKIGIDPATKNLYLAIIGDGEELASKINLGRGAEAAQQELRELAVKTLKEFNGDGEVTEGQIEGFSEMCKILQICDGGAYTSMAVTRRGKGMGIYRNAHTFNTTFASPHDPGKRRIRLAQPGGRTAPNDLTPQPATKPKSRIRINGNKSDAAARRISVGAADTAIDRNGVG